MNKLSLLLPLMIALSPPAARAVEEAIDCNAGTHRQRLDNRYFLDECHDATPAVQEIDVAVRKGFGPYQSDASIVTWPRKAEDELKRIRQAVQVEQAKAQESGNTRLSDKFGAMHERLGATIAKITSVGSTAELDGQQGSAKPPELQPDFWRVARSKQATRGEFAIQYLNEENCLDVERGEPRCDAIYIDAVRLADHTYAASAVIAKLHLPTRADFRARAIRRSEAWNAYFYEAQFQYWWELVANKYLDAKCPHGPNAFIAPLIHKRCERPLRDSWGNPIGFREPPDYKATLLHPDIGLMYIDGEPKGDRFKPAIVIQAFGYEWWDWKDAKIENRKGISLAIAAADNNEIDGLGYGLQFRWNGYAIAVTDHGGTLAVTLNLDLTKYLATTSPKYAEELQAPLAFK